MTTIQLILIIIAFLQHLHPHVSFPGIQPSYQHLLLGNRELLDDACLIDQQVVDGSTLRLVLAVRGGPINARRLQTHEDQFLRDLGDYVDANR